MSNWLSWVAKAITTACLLAILPGCFSSRQVADSTPPPIRAEAVAEAQPRPDPILSAGNTSPYTVNGQTYTVLPTAYGYREQGIASWYGLKFHGRKTANGERFSVYGPTAAHKTLPIPSYVRVTNLDNNRAMVLRVNDRGPFHPDRVIDLSYGAAIKLGFADQGTARVLVEAIEVAGVDDRRSVDGGYRFIQLGAFASLQSAEDLQAQVVVLLKARTDITAIDVDERRLFRLRVGPFDLESQIHEAQARLRAAGLPAGQLLP